MMEVEEIAKALRGYIMQRYAIPTGDAEFTDDVHLFDYGYVDSFGAVDLVSFVEQTFGVRVSQSDMIAYPMNTINEIATFASLRQKGEI
jgi:methoxymalonate biosynthesis acyl carrier protein